MTDKIAVFSVFICRFYAAESIFSPNLQIKITFLGFLSVVIPFLDFNNPKTYR